MVNRKIGTIVVGPFVSVFGGAEIVKLSVARFFLRKGWRVVLAGLAESSFAKICKLFGNGGIKDGIELYSMFKFFPEMFGLYQPVIGFRAVENAANKLRPDIVFIDYEGSQRISYLWRKERFKLIKYIHFPQSIHLFARRDPARFRRSTLKT